MTDDSTPNVPRNRRTLRLLAAGGATAVLLAGGSVAAFAAAGTPTGMPKPSATATPGAPGQPGPNGGARPSPPVHKPHLIGTVTAVSGSIITITDRDGFSREIKVTGSTTYADGLTAIPQVGDKIHAEGTVDSDKTSLDATTVRRMTERTPPAPRGPDGHGHRGPGGPGGLGAVGGPGGPGGHRQGGTATPRPSGSATPSPAPKP